MRTWLIVCAACLLGTKIGSAGEIAGMRSSLPPTLDPDLAINFSNDFLGRGGSIDDFRTTQLIVSARFQERWLAVFDHSALTLDRDSLAGRIDQTTLSLGYRLLDVSSTGRRGTLAFGSGVRRYGKFAGDRMQNGFHRLISSDVNVLPYVDSGGDDITLWLDADYMATFSDIRDWRLAWWLRGNTLWSGSGQWDSSASAYLVAARGPFELWFGGRSDWRSGYDQDFVQAATADAESDVSVVIGLRLGALVLETAQQLNNDASFGQLKLVSDARHRYPIDGSLPKLAIEFALLVPDVYVDLAGKYRSHLWISRDSAWQQSIVVAGRYGEPQYGDNPEHYRRTRQLSAALEWERPVAVDWLSAYLSAGLGWRSEQLFGDAGASGIESDTVSKGVGTASAGLRMTAASLGGRWRYRLQLGFSTWLPFSEETVEFAGSVATLHSTSGALSLGMSFDFL